MTKQLSLMKVTLEAGRLGHWLFECFCEDTHGRQELPLHVHQGTCPRC